MAVDFGLCYLGCEDDVMVDPTAHFTRMNDLLPWRDLVCLFISVDPTNVPWLPY